MAPKQTVISKMNTGTLKRSLSFAREAINPEKRTIDISFSSEEPVERWFGQEILDHQAKSIRLGRIQTGGPLLLDHNPSRQIGVIEEVSIDHTARKGRAVVRFGKSVLAQEIFDDVNEGIRQNISVGYQIFRMVLEEQGKDKPDIYRATDWEPAEISIVSVPADISVGVGRSGPVGEHETLIENLKRENSIMPEKNPQTPETKAQEPVSVTVDVKAVADDARKQELGRIREITAIGERFKKTDLARQFIDNGQDIAAFREAVLEKMGETSPTPVTPVGRDLLNAKEDQDYSIVRALQAAATGAWDGAGFEREISNDIAKKLGRSTDGVFVPTGLGVRAPLVAGTDGSGGYTVQTTVQPIIELLRNRMVTRKLGARVLSGLSGKLSFPRQLTTPSLNWTTENPGSDTSDFDATSMFGQVGLEPRTAIATVPYSKQLLAESSADIEQFMRDDLATVNALGVDLAALNGSGSSGQPTGILNTSGIGAVAIGDNGGAPTWAHVVNLETEVAVDNADIGALAYLTNAKVRGKLKQTEKASGTGQFVWEDGNEAGFGSLNGYRAAVSNQVPSTLVKGTSGAVCSAGIFGNWNDLMIGEWGVMELIADPYSLKKQGLVEITSFILVDVAVRHPQSFAAILDILTT